MEVSRHNSIQVFNIPMDCNFASVTLRNGTWIKILQSWTIKSDEKKDEKSLFYVHHEKKFMLTSYINTKKSGNQNLIGLINMHNNVKISNHKRGKPQFQYCQFAFLSSDN